MYIPVSSACKPVLDANTRLYITYNILYTFIMGPRTWRLVVGVYVLTFLVSIPWNWLLRRFKHAVLNNHINTVINQLLVKDYGYLWFTAIYTCAGAYIYFCSVGSNSTNWSSGANGSKGQIDRMIKVFLGNTIFLVFTNVWCFGPSIFERIDMLNGGHCEERSGSEWVGDYSNMNPRAAALSGSINPETERTPSLTPSQCLRDSNRYWVDGFDVSGHYYLIISMSLLLWDLLIRYHILNWRKREVVDLELQSIYSMAQQPATNITTVQLLVMKRTVQVCSIALLLIWYFEFAVTSLFFHTTLEKLWGLIFGAVVPLMGHFL